MTGLDRERLIELLLAARNAIVCDLDGQLAIRLIDDALAALPAEPEQESPRFSTASTFRAPTDEEMAAWTAEDERWSKGSAEPVRATDPVRAAAEGLIAEWVKASPECPITADLIGAIGRLRAALAADREPVVVVPMSHDRKQQIEVVQRTIANAKYGGYETACEVVDALAALYPAEPPSSIPEGESDA